MSGKAQLGLQGYVYNKNGHPTDAKESNRGNVKRSHEDLKMPLPTNRPTQSGHPSGVNAQTSKRSVQVKMEHDADPAHASSRHLSGGRGAFYDTDASSIGRTSTAASVNGEVANAAEDNEGEEYPSDVNEEQDEEDEPDEAELRAYAPEPDEATRRAYALAHEVHIGAIQLPRGTGLPQVKGDSYPSTTSGNPSVSEVPNGGATQNAEPHRRFQGLAQNLTNRQSSQRRTLTKAPESTSQMQPPAYPHPLRGNNNRAEPGSIGRPDGSNKDAVQQIQAGFSYAPPQQQQRTRAAPTRNPEQKAVSRASAPTPSTNTVQPTTGPTNDDRSHDLFSGQQHQHGEKQRNRDALQNVYETAQSRQLPQDSVGQQDQRVGFGVAVERLRSQHEETDHVQGGGRNSHQHEPEEDLDYGVPYLYEMDYHALKKEPFDIDPNAQRVDGGQQHEAVTDRMAAIQRMQADAQAQFFGGLSIREWEQGGDWFLDQFSTILNQLKDVRQQRRKAAQEYEDDIEGRFKAVGQKRKQIDVALSEMKESGGKVLQGTPKKSKTK